MLKRWFKNKIDKVKAKLLEQYLEDLYDYRLKFLLKDAIELVDNTWDKDRIKRIILGLSSINLERYANDDEIKQLIYNKFNNKKEQ